MSLFPLFKNNNPRSHLQHPFTMDMWDSFRDFHNHHEAILAQHTPLLHPNTTIAPSSGAMVDWNETPDAHVLTTELPGFNKDEVKVMVQEGKFLKISGKKKVDKEEKHENWHRVQHKEGKFSRVFTLPENSNADRVKSQFENGILTITVPKRDVKNSHIVKSFQVKG